MAQKLALIAQSQTFEKLLVFAHRHFSYLFSACIFLYRMCIDRMIYVRCSIVSSLSNWKQWDSIIMKISEEKSSTLCYFHCTPPHLCEMVWLVIRLTGKFVCDMRNNNSTNARATANNSTSNEHQNDKEKWQTGDIYKLPRAV